ncbi:MAG: efflux RND transporter periplasmic adaptor subunit [Acidobacteria bacterium]|nr:efflux RND transporter periplasmic adaptor subunit [Acidobacteriota bacterium]
MRHAAAITALFLASCSKTPERRAEPAPPAAVPVRTAVAAHAEWASVYEATGTVRARTSAPVAAKLMGYAREVRAQTGDVVKQGQVLVVLDSRDLDAAAERAQAAREEVKSAIPEAEGAIAGAQSQMDLAQLTFNRMQDLLRKKSVTQQEFDEASARLKSAQAALDMAKARRAQLTARMAQAEHEVRSAGINRGYTEVTAPFTGVILTRSVEPGTLAVPGSPLFTMELVGAYRLEAVVEESRIAQVRVGQTAAVALDGLDRKFNGRVAEIVPSVDPASRAGTVKINLPALAQLRSGLFGRAAFPSGSRTVLAIPASAVIERGQLQSVFAIESGAAHIRLVTLGERRADEVEVLSGLNLGDTVVTPVPRALSDGTPVEVQR